MSDELLELLDHLSVAETQRDAALARAEAAERELGVHAAEALRVR